MAPGADAAPAVEAAADAAATETGAAEADESK